ncbi:putative mediator of RNA polymerase II transcription subunit 24 [Oppia nitens]|uniref:putative mediator of RNA polymerase II transcription subunit 24 n=1 Tax=Oppia nitens TaxID=1686743 RepID=UPI0023D9CF49|nr:putative mediator of RNA polymerase II transcription subunit 24 [Oppia nitens]
MSKIKLIMQLPWLVILLAIVSSQFNNLVKCDNNNTINNAINNYSGNNLNNNSGNNINNNSGNNLNNNSGNNINNNSGNNINNNSGNNLNNNNGNNLNNNSGNNLNNNSGNNINNNSGNNLNKNNSMFPDLPPIPLLTSRMTGQWYAIYGSNLKEFRHLVIEKVIGSYPPELILKMSSGPNRQNMTGYTVLDNNNYIYVTYDNGMRVYYYVLEYDSERYFVMMFTPTVNKKGGLIIYSRSEQTVPENTRLMNKIYRSLDRLGFKGDLKQLPKLQPKPKPKPKPIIIRHE